MKKALVIVALFVSVASATSGSFYVYQDAMSRENHFIPSGWMGDYSDIKFNQRWEEKPASGKYSIQIKYSAERKQNAGWAGIYWQNLANNWGDKKTKGHDLSGYKKLKFKVRGEKGKEFVDKFFFGGISGAESWDTGSNDSGGIELTKDWREYEIDLAGQDMTGIIGGFGFAVNSEMNPAGAVFYIDEIRYEK